MVVESVTPLSKTRFQITLEDGSSFVLYKKEVVQFHVEEGADVSEATIDQIKKDILLKRAKLRALYLLNDMDRTEHGLRKKLENGGYPPDVIEKVLDYVKSYKYLDDRRYIENYIYSKIEQKSRNEILAHLCAKGLSKDLIEEELSKVSDKDTERKAIERLLMKKRYAFDTSTHDEKMKMIAYLQRKGFRYEDIRQVIQVSSSNA